MFIHPVIPLSLIGWLCATRCMTTDEYEALLLDGRLGRAYYGDAAYHWILSYLMDETEEAKRIKCQEDVMCWRDLHDTLEVCEIIDMYTNLNIVNIVDSRKQSPDSPTPSN